jgi:hypothetical protein
MVKRGYHAGVITKFRPICTIVLFAGVSLEYTEMKEMQLGTMIFRGMLEVLGKWVALKISCLLGMILLPRRI